MRFRGKLCPRKGASSGPFSSRFAARRSTSPEKKFVKLGRDSLLRPLSRTGGELVALSWGPGLFFEVLGTRLRFFGDGWVPTTGMPHKVH